MNSIRKVYAVVAKIPKGKVSTYKKVAQLAGLNPPAGGPRLVGLYLHQNKNPEKIPCHRVVGSKGELKGYAFGGIKKKREMLKKEGVFFLDEGTVDLTKSLILLPLLPR